MIAKLAYLTSPAPNRFILHVQAAPLRNTVEGDGDDIYQFEISEAHLANIIIDGASFALRSHRVPELEGTRSLD
jgi:hypothetical protein